MSWEPVDALPGARAGGGAFREGAEPVLAERPAPGAFERARLFFGSTPEQPYRAMVERAVLTGGHLYVERSDGTRARLPREAILGVRLEGRKLVVRVADAPALALVHRPGCPLEAALVERAKTSGFDDVFLSSHWLRASPVLALLLFGAAYLSLGEAYEERDLLGAVPGLALALGGLYFVLWVPTRWRVDRLGVVRSRGLVPWVRFRAMPEQVRGVELRESHVKPKNGPRYHAGYWVVIVLRRPMRLGTLTRQERVDLEVFGFSSGAASHKKQVRGRAAQLAGRIRRMMLA